MLLAILYHKKNDKMKLAAKGYESIRLSFNINTQELYKLESKKQAIFDLKNQMDLELDFETDEVLNIEELQKIEEQIRKLKRGLIDFQELEAKLLDVAVRIQENELWDRYLTDVFVVFENKEYRIAQIGKFKDINMFGLGFIKLDGVFFALLKNKKTKKHLKNKLEAIRKHVERLPFEYLNRIDFYFDFVGTIKEFRKKAKIRWFKNGGIVGGAIDHGGKVEVKETSTIYWGNTEGRRIVARLYNKRVDSVKKGKVAVYDWINNYTKRFEIQVEVEELRDLKKQFEGQTIKEFILFVAKNVVYKQRKGVYKFDVDIIFQKIAKAIEKIKYVARKTRNIARLEDDSFKLKLFFGWCRNMAATLGDIEYINFQSFILKNI